MKSRDVKSWNDTNIFRQLLSRDNSATLLKVGRVEEIREKIAPINDNEINEKRQDAFVTSANKVSR